MNTLDKLYDIYDSESGIFVEDKRFHAKHARHAVQKYLDLTKSDATFRRAGKLYGRAIKATPVKVENDCTYYNGKVTWFQIL